MTRVPIHPKSRLPVGALLVVCTSLCFARSALALQPVTDFLQHARTWNPRNQAARATTAQRDAEVAVSTGSLLPSFSASGTYTRNQYEVTTAALIPAGSGGSTMNGGLSIPNIVIQPLDQFDANLMLTVPILNVANWDRRAAATASLEGARADAANTELVIAKNVIRDFYTLVGDQAVLLSATHNVDIARHEVKLARDRKDSGTGSELDVQRALADQAKAEQNVTAAELGVATTARDLYSLSGLMAEPATNFPEDDLHEESPLGTWTARADVVPSVKSAAASRKAAEEGADAAKVGWLPSISALAEERFTNATAFIGGHPEVYLFQATATWKLDTTIDPQIRAQNAAAVAARAAENSARQSAEDAVFRDWQQIHADIETARSARAQLVALQLAATLAEDRYSSGVATQLDVLQARQDAFAADVARIQADSDLAYARMALRLDAGALDAMAETR